jgi:hypothetical protein
MMMILTRSDQQAARLALAGLRLAAEEVHVLQDSRCLLAARRC